MLDHMTRLAELGCRFALDNFGIGTSSVASLGTLPVDYVKLDGSLVRGVDQDAARRDIVRALATVARALGKEVIAGWAEREEVVRLLPGLGIELAQGHSLGRPTAELRRGAEPVVRALRTRVDERGEHIPWILPDAENAGMERVAV
jgi:EAL domain-containing protein (putative c-di-GMP-specific phosphodiesterase class I)